MSSLRSDCGKLINTEATHRSGPERQNISTRCKHLFKSKGLLALARRSRLISKANDTNLLPLPRFPFRHLFLTQGMRTTVIRTRRSILSVPSRLPPQGQHLGPRDKWSTATGGKRITEAAHHSPSAKPTPKPTPTPQSLTRESQLVPAFSKGIGRGERVRDQKSGMEASKHFEQLLLTGPVRDEWKRAVDLPLGEVHSSRSNTRTQVK